MIRMSIMRSLFSFMLLTTSHALICEYTIQDTQNLVDNQQMGSSLPDFFFSPLEYSSSSISFFLKRTYNHPKFPQEFLALNFLHVISGISLAPQSEQPRRFIKKIVDLMSQKLQQIYVNPYAYEEMLNDCVIILAQYCDSAREKSQLVDAFKESIGSCLVDDFFELKNNPDAVLKRLSEKLYTIAHNDNDDLSVRELQHSVFHFLSRGLALLIWSPHDQADCWRTTRTIGRYLEKYADLGIIDAEMLDHLLWTLLRRFGFFVALAGTDLQSEFFDAVSKDLKQEQDGFWLAPERESYIETKLEYLQKVLVEAELTSRMRSSGLIIPFVR